MILRTEREEILDREGQSERGRKILHDLERINHISGWYRMHQRQVQRHWEALGRPSPFRILDVGTGPGTLIEQLDRWALRHGVRVELTGVDRSPNYVAMARERLGDKATVMEADATALPMADQSFDLVTNTLMMHHLPMSVRTAMVHEFARVARSAYIFDLEISWTGALGWPPLAVALGMGTDTIHDGWISVRRGSTLAEFQALMAPLPVRVVRRFPSLLLTVPR